MQVSGLVEDPYCLFVTVSYSCLTQQQQRAGRGTTFKCTLHKYIQP